MDGSIDDGLLFRLIYLTSLMPGPGRINGRGPPQRVVFYAFGFFQSCKLPYGKLPSGILTHSYDAMLNQAL
jgi:hypothetical protein